MKAKSVVDERLLLVVAFFCAAHVASLKLVDTYNIDIGVLGGVIVELVTIPVMITSLFIFFYALFLIVFKKRISIVLLLSLLCSFFVGAMFVKG